MLSAKILAAATLGLSVLTFASTASATSLVPNREGEIKTENLGCIVAAANCIDTTNPTQSPFTYKVKSLEYDFDGLNPQFIESRLFVDNRSTENDYGFGIKFGETDKGTNPPPGEYWFRPVAQYIDGVDEDGKPLVKAFEDGQLEVGRFLFDFLGKTVSSVTFDLFDVEDADFTKILEVNDQALNPEKIAIAGADGNRQQITIYDVKSFKIQLGKPGPNSVFSNTGDGVAMRASVPEPATVISLGALAVAGMFGTRQRRRMGV